MKNKLPIISVFLLVAFLQWLVPTVMIYNKNITDTTGTSFRFKVRPVDPAHPFAGRYMSLKYDQDYFTIKPGAIYNSGLNLYAEIIEGADHYAIIKEIAFEPFTHTSDYVKVTVQYTDQERVYITYPFEQFYMKENKAKEVDKHLVTLLGDTTIQVYSKVIIRNGDAVLKDVFVDNQPIGSLY